MPGVRGGVLGWTMRDGDGKEKEMKGRIEFKNITIDDGPAPGRYQVVTHKIEGEEDICGLCGLPGADKYRHPIHWPGERIPDGMWVHAECESEECRRAHAAMSDRERKAFLRTI